MSLPGLRRVLLILGVTCVLAGTGSPASATDTAFSVAYVHANGAGATAAKTTGGFVWLNRSVRLPGVRFYVKPGHCASFEFTGFRLDDANDELVAIDFFMYESLCHDGWVNFGDHFLDASDTYGGIRLVQVVVKDLTHQGSTFLWYER